jgi:hypothetical protein
MQAAALSAAVFVCGCGESLASRALREEKHRLTCVGCKAAFDRLEVVREIVDRAHGFHLSRRSVVQCCDEGLRELGVADQLISICTSDKIHVGAGWYLERAKDYRGNLLAQRRWYE